LNSLTFDFIFIPGLGFSGQESSFPPGFFQRGKVRRASKSIIYADRSPEMSFSFHPSKRKALLFVYEFLFRLEKLPIRENRWPSSSFLGRSKTDRWTTWPSMGWK